jgi:hypothetical protein
LNRPEHRHGGLDPVLPPTGSGSAAERRPARHCFGILVPFHQPFSLGNAAKLLELPASELEAVDDEPIVVAPHQADAPLTLTHDKAQHTTTTEFVLCNTACELLLANQPEPRRWRAEQLTGRSSR